MTVSKLAQNIIGSEIIKLAAEVNDKISKGEKIYNFTIGDFDPREFPIPDLLKQYIIEEYQNDQTNYPAADGVPELRKAISHLLKERGNLIYQPNEILVAGGARPFDLDLRSNRISPKTQRIDVHRVELAARGPCAHFLAQARRQYGLAAQRPEALDDDRQPDRRQQQQRDHRPAAGLHQFEHARPSGP